MILDFEKTDGLIPAIVQDNETNKVLMLAFVNEEAFQYTLKTKKATFWSRSRNKIWCKGEESGNFMEIVDILTDCDNDTLIYKVIPHGLKAACHEGYESCFFKHLVNGEWIYNDEPLLFDPEKIYKK